MNEATHTAAAAAPTPPPNVTEADAFCPVEGHGAYIARTYRVLADQVAATTKCPKCDHAAAMRADRSGQQSETEAQATARRAWEASRGRLRTRLGALARLPAMFEGVTVREFVTGDDLARAAAKRAVVAFLEGWEHNRKTGGSLLFAGKTGTGKTHLAAAAFSHVTKTDPFAVAAFGTVAQVMRFIRSTYAKDSGRTEDDAHSDLLDVDLLVLDEVGASGGTDHERNTLFEILNARYANNRSTIAIANYTPDELGGKDLLGERVMSRFRQKGSVVAFTWNDFRGGAA